MMETTRRKRVLFPFLALLLTIAAFALVMFCGFLSSPVLVRLLQGSSGSFSSLSWWLQYCLLHPMLLKTLGRVGFGVSVLGSMLTLLLLLKTEPTTIANRHLTDIGWAVVLMTGLLFGLMLGGVLFSMLPALIGGSLINQFKSATVPLLLCVPVFTALCFVLVTIPFAFGKIIGRLKASTSARQMPHVLQ